MDIVEIVADGLIDFHRDSMKYIPHEGSVLLQPAAFRSPMQLLAPHRYAGLGPHVEVATRDLDALFTLTTA